MSILNLESQKASVGGFKGVSREELRAIQANVEQNMASIEETVNEYIQQQAVEELQYKDHPTAKIVKRGMDDLLTGPDMREEEVRALTLALAADGEILE